MSTTEHLPNPSQLGDDPPWYAPCLQDVISQGYNASDFCTELHCTDSQNWGHSICNCIAPHLDGCTKVGYNDGNCCSYDNNSAFEVMTESGTCFCCCGCFADDTLIAIDATHRKAVQDFLVGDSVWVATGVDLATWEPAPVRFSQGTGGQGNNEMMMVRFGDPAKPDFVISTRDQLFLLADRKLKRGARLVPGVDQLLRPDGSAARVLDLTVGRFRKGVHQIATSKQPTTEVARHLIQANGVVCGDYALQLTDLDAKQPDVLVEGHKELPEMGTRQYAERYRDLDTDAFGTRPRDLALPPIESSLFFPLGVVDAAKVPAGARSFVTKRQAEDIQKHAPRYPTQGGSSNSSVKYLLSLFGGFYPSVMFRVDADNDVPNAYAYLDYDVPFVILNSGLLRLEALTFDGYALVIAQLLGAFYGGDPTGPGEYSCTGVADYGAVAGILPAPFFPSRSRPVLEKGIEEINAVWEYIDPKHRGGLPGNRCDAISIDCRKQALHAAFTSQPLPYCAGGPPEPTLEVEGATASSGSSGTTVTVTFNESLDPASAGSLGNYSFDPVVAATAVTLEADHTAVVIDVALEVGTEYLLTVEDVLSADDHPLVPDKSTATVKLES